MRRVFLIGAGIPVRLICGLLLVCFQIARAEQYFLRRWTVEEQLPQNTVQALCQTRDGYLWIGTPSGLARFDGFQFRRFGKQNVPEMHSDDISALYADPAGTLWIGTRGGGLTAYDQGSWRRISREDGLSDDHIRCITSDWEGALWVGTDYGLNRITMGGIEQFTREQGLLDNIITALVLDVAGTLWIGTLQGGLASYQDGNIQRFGLREGLSNLAVTCLELDSLGNLWVGTLEGLFCRRWQVDRFEYIPGTAYTPVTGIVAMAPDQLWFATMTDGLKQLQGRYVQDCQLNPDLPDRYLNCMLRDQQGFFWLGTDIAGLLQLKPVPIRNLTRENGLLEETVAALLTDAAGDLWLGTRNSGLCRVRRDSVVQILDEAGGLVSNSITALLVDQENTLWLGTRGSGVNRLAGSRIELLDRGRGLSSDLITALAEDNSGTIWIGTADGLNRLVGDSCLVYRPPDGSNTPGVAVILPTEDGLYIGTRGGLFYRTGETIQKLSPDDQDRKWEVSALYQDSAGCLWIGTNGNGLQCYRGGEFHALSSTDGLPSDHILGITEDDGGRLWLSSPNGIIVYPKVALSRFFDGDTLFVWPGWLTETDGLRSRQCTGIGSPRIWNASTGEIYIPTIQGVAVIKSAGLFDHPWIPGVVVEAVQVDGEPLALMDSVNIGIRQTLRIAFTAFDYSAPEKLRFRYRLEGSSESWQNLAPDAVREVVYRNLKPGLYRFHVQAISNAGQMNTPTTVLNIRVLRPFLLKPFSVVLELWVLLSIVIGIRILLHRVKLARQPEKYHSSSLNPEQVTTKLPELRRLIEQEQLYLNPNLTLQELARPLRIHPNHLSRIINENFHINFNDFINQYRIEEAQQRLKDPANRSKTVLEIMYAVGFNSKSVFNTAFKKKTGQTPTAWRKQQLS
jgi:ligand-binding sensor domain-containing protein/AraC-like DNA-binding protein